MLATIIWGQKPKPNTEKGSAESKPGTTFGRSPERPVALGVAPRVGSRDRYGDRRSLRASVTSFALRGFFLSKRNMAWIYANSYRSCIFRKISCMVKRTNLARLASPVLAPMPAAGGGTPLVRVGGARRNRGEPVPGDPGAELRAEPPAELGGKPPHRSSTGEER